jgi:3-hydroxybutyryl-CoA dehydratase
MTRLRPFPEVRHRVDGAAISMYAEVSGDYNPLHVDPDYAAAGPFGVVVAHGPIALQAVYEAVATWLGCEGLPAGVTVDVAFRGPIPIGSTVVCRAAEVLQFGAVVVVMASCTVDDREVLQALVKLPRRLAPV